MSAGGQSDQAACDKSQKMSWLSHCPYLSTGLNRKQVTRINSMPNIGSRPRQVIENRVSQNVVQNQNLSTSHIPLEVGSMVEVVSNSGVTVYGVVQWLGVPEGKTGEWAGIELVSDWSILPLYFFSFNFLSYLLYHEPFQDYDINGCSDGKYGGQRYFTCKGNRALFVPITKCSPDSRFVSSTGRAFKPTETPPGKTHAYSVNDKNVRLHVALYKYESAVQIHHLIKLSIFFKVVT